MKIEDWRTSRPKPYEKNPRKNAGAVDKVAASIEQFGFRQPIVVDDDGVIIMGHTRLLAAKKLGLEKVPVHVAVGLSPEKVKALRLADNRLAEEASWDNDLLGVELKELFEAGFNLEWTGFDESELRNLLEPDVDETVDEIPDVAAVPISVPGDIWLLGDHRLICGDSTDAGVVNALLAGVKPHLMVTDPPYGVEYDANWRNEAARDGATANRKRGSIGGQAVGKVLNDDRADWHEAWALFPGDVAYVWHAGLYAPVVAASLEATGFAVRSQIIWSKNNFAIGRGDYHWKHEPCWYAVREGRTGHWNSDRKQTTVWEIGKPQSSETGHSTQKPVECMKRPIENNSKKGDAVYEPFAGSGTTLIAAQLTGRRCFAIELNPLYVDLIVRRFEQLTGIDAVHEDRGLGFAQITLDRQSQSA